MLDCRAVFEAFRGAGITFFAGVPDSLMEAFCSLLVDACPPDEHVITANEGGAVALASGHHLATGGLPLVYLQNSGLGNAVNPLLSHADRAVYGIPMLLLVGWRGEPGTADEPQHVKQGQATLPLLEAMDIRYRLLPKTVGRAAAAIEEAADASRAQSEPVALVVRRGLFAPYELQTRPSAELPMTREQALRLVLENTDPHAAVVATTGKTSREVFEYAFARRGKLSREFLTVGAMGHASLVALGIALADQKRPVCCLDGDGALLMHLGALATIGARRPANFCHLVLNNGVHDSVGGQPTGALAIDLPAIAKACGYRQAERASSAEELLGALNRLAAAPGPSLLEIRIKPGSRPDLGVPTTPPAENKQAFVDFLRSR